MSSAMFIEIRIQNVYGNDLIYPVCDKAKVFASMLGTKTLTRSAIDHIKRLGYEIRVQPQTL